MIGPDPLDLDGQVALVTGAGQGAGRSIALQMAHHNAGGVAVNDFVLERAEAVAEEIKALGVPAIGVQADVGDYASVEAAVDKAEAALGPVTILVNNAGNAGPQTSMQTSPPFWETSPEDWQRFFHTNLFGVMNCCHVVIPRMIKQGRGRLLTIISDAARVGEARLVTYSAAKAGAAGFIRSIARETGRYGITSNAISLSTLVPPLDEDTLAKFLASDQSKSQLEKYTIRRYGQPEDVATMAVFLCSEAASWITGQTYPVNGGYSFTQ